MASKRKCQPRSDGEHRVVLDSSIQFVGRTFHCRVGEPGGGKESKGPQDRSQGCGASGGSIAPQSCAIELYPPEPVRQLRDLTRRRIQLTQDASRERNRVQKLLEQANVKIASVLSDVFGVSGQNMVLALLAGQTTPEEIAQLAR